MRVRRTSSSRIWWRYAAALRWALLGCSLALASVDAQQAAPRASRRLKVVVVVFDGLRPDLVTAARTPSLHAFGTDGVVSQRHHALFPTVTRVNASALATGASPGGHGVLDNTIYLPAVHADRTLNTGDAADMLLADSALGGRLLTAPSLAERLAPVGARVVVASAGSSGSAYLLAGAGRAVTINAEFVRPAALAAVIDRRLGPPPGDTSPNLGLNARAVDALLRIGIDSLDADVGYLWLSDPDHTAHGAGLGSIMADSSIRAADREFGRLLDGLRARGLRTQTDIMVVSDHGFSTHAGARQALPALFAPMGPRVMIAGSAVYVRSGGDSTRTAVVDALLRSPVIGAVFSAPLDAANPDVASVPGTLSYGAIGWAHPRSGDLLFSADWSHRANANGVAGTTQQSGVAGHGTSSAFDIAATFVAGGPHFRHGVRAPLASSNADVVPTILRLLGMAPQPAGTTGRPLDELLRGALRPATPPVVRHDSLVAARRLVGDAPVDYRSTLYRTRVGTTWYFDSTKTTRTPPRDGRETHRP